MLLSCHNKISLTAQIPQTFLTLGLYPDLIQIH